MKKIEAQIVGEIISSNAPEAYALSKKSYFGEAVGDKIQYSLSEVLFLVEKSKMDVFSRGKKVAKKELLKKLQRVDKRIQIKFPVFRPKSALCTPKTILIPRVNKFHQIS